MSGKDGRSRSEDMMVTYDVKADGTWTATTALGALSGDASGKIEGIINDVRAIAIGNVTSLKTHQIDESAGAVSHWMTFSDGGSCRLTYRKTGEVIEFKVGRVRLRVNHEKVLIINPLD